MALAATSCSPLKKMAAESHEALSISDTTFAELIRREIEHRYGTLRETVVEFYPPAELPKPGDEPFPILSIRSAPFFRRRRFRQPTP